MVETAPKGGEVGLNIIFGSLLAIDLISPHGRDDLIY